jgi:hypothetical protein
MGRDLPIALLLSSAHAFALMTGQLSTSVASPQPVGTPILWTATAIGVTGGSLEYQFSAGLAHGALVVASDFAASNQFV